MPRHSLPATALSIALHPAFRGLPIGLLLGAMSWGIAQTRVDDPMMGCATALLLVVSGTASSVCHAMHVEPKARHKVGAWLMQHAIGLLAALMALNFFVG